MSDLAQYPIMHACAASHRDADVVARESHDRGAGRHSPRRGHPAAAGTAGGRSRRARPLLRGSLSAQPVPPFPRDPSGGRTPRGAGARPGLGRARSTARIGDRGRRGSHRRSGELRAAARSEERRGRLCRGRRLPGSRNRDPDAGTTDRARRSTRNRAIRGGGDGGQRADDRRLRGCRVRGLENSRGRGGGDDLPDRRHRGLRLPRGGTRPHRRRRVAAPLLRSSDGRGRRGVVTERDDRGRALPEHHRGRVRGLCVSDQSQRRAGGGRPRVCLDLRDPGSAWISSWSACRRSPCSTQCSPPWTRASRPSA